MVYTDNREGDFMTNYQYIKVLKGEKMPELKVPLWAKIILITPIIPYIIAFLFILSLFI
jgi:hypothetical protein